MLYNLVSQIINWSLESHSFFNIHICRLWIRIVITENNLEIWYDFGQTHNHIWTLFCCQIINFDINFCKLRPFRIIKLCKVKIKVKCLSIIQIIASEQKETSLLNLFISVWLIFRRKFVKPFVVHDCLFSFSNIAPSYHSLTDLLALNSVVLHVEGPRGIFIHHALSKLTLLVGVKEHVTIPIILRLIFIKYGPLG